VGAFDVVRYKRFRVFKADTSCQFQCVEIDTSGEVVFAGSFDPYEIYSWSVQTGHLLQVVGGHEGPVSCLAMIGEQLISGSWDRTLKIHEIFSKKVNVETFDHNSEITAIAIHPNRKQIAASTMKGEIYLWQTDTASLSGIIESEMTGGRSYFSKISAENDKSTKYLKSLVYSPCGNYLYGGGKSKYLIVYDIQHRMVLTKIPLTKNKDLQGVVEKLNSRYIKNGTPTYELTLQAQ
jgi:periodic tryptophan protein 2